MLQQQTVASDTEVSPAGVQVHQRSSESRLLLADVIRLLTYC